MIGKLIDLCLQNRLLVVALSALLMGLGVYGYRGLPVDAFPDVSPNLVQVFTVTEGLAPEEVEKYVTYPIEASMNGLPGVENIRSISNFGLSVINVYFEEGVDVYFARQLVGERLQEARDRIPEGFGEPEMGPIATGMGLVLFYYLEDSSGRSLEELRTIQDWIVKFHLQTVPGVTEVLGIGGYEKQFQVIVDPHALLRYGITLSTLVERIEANNRNVGAQFIVKGAEELVIRSVGLASGLEDLRSIIVETRDGTPIFLRDVAEVRIGGAVRRGLQTRNGEREVVAGMVVKLFGTNSSSVIRKVEEKLEKINDILPDGVRIVPYYEQRSLVEAAVGTVASALTQGIALVALVLLVFMGGLRPSLVVVISLPFSVLFACLMLWRVGFSANLMSLGGLAIAIGMMVDGTIVMVENVDRRLRQADGEESRVRIVADACKEVGRPVAFAISIIVVVFFPLFTLQGVEGKTFRPLAFSVAFAMAGSLLFAMTAAPVVSSLLMRRSGPSGGNAPNSFLLRALLVPYCPLVRFFVRFRWAAAGMAVALLGAGLLVFPLLGSEFTPRLNEGTIVVRLTMAPSISLAQSKKTTMLVERRLMKVPDVTGVVTRVGRGEVGAHTDPINSAEVFVQLEPPEEWRHPRDQGRLEESLREAIGDPPGVFVSFTQPIEMTVDELLEGVRAELAIKVFGDDLAVLKESGDEIAAAVGEVRGAADVQVDQVSGTPQLLIRVDRQAIARYGVNVSDVQQVIRAAVGGVEAGEIFEGVRRFDILVRYAPEFRSRREAIADILIEVPGGVKVPLQDLASIDEVVGPRQITRQNNQRFITVQCNVRDRDIGSFVQEAQETIERRVDLPPGYLTTWGGQFRLQQEANRRLAVVVPVTVLLVFLLLYMSFGSMKNSLLILLNIPLALVGGVVALWVSGQNLSVPASVGLIALFGIALENAMVLVTCLDQLCRRGLPVDEASVEGACDRLRPVLMTAVTTALGLFPLLFAQGTGSEVQRPLATVVVGGLASSTLLTLLVLPALYKWFRA